MPPDAAPPTEHDETEHDGPDAGRSDDDHVSALAARVGSDAGVAIVKWGVMAIAVAFLVGALGYAIGVRSTARPSSAADIGFLQDMTDHHDQAVEIAGIARRGATDPVVASMANEVVMFQRYELGQMATMLQDQGADPLPYEADRTSMAWMGMATPLRLMNGMASDEQIKALESASGKDVDIMFLKIMIAHHQGGVHMGEEAAHLAADPAVRAFAAKLAANQATEIREYEGVLARVEAS